MTKINTSKIIEIAEAQPMCLRPIAYRVMLTYVERGKMTPAQMEAFVPEFYLVKDVAPVVEGVIDWPEITSAKKAPSRRKSGSTVNDSLSLAKKTAENLDARRREFQKRVHEINSRTNLLGRRALENFMSHWSEVPDNGWVMRFERQDVFNAEARMRRLRKMMDAGGFQHLRDDYQQRRPAEDWA